MTGTSESGATTRTCHVFIKATPDAVWHAITATQWNQQTGYQSAADHDSPASGKASPPDGNDVVVVGDVLAAEPPRKLVQTWRTLPLRLGAAARLTRLTWEIEESLAGVTVLTLTRQRDGAPPAGSQVPDTGTGWCRLLSDVKTALETLERRNDRGEQKRGATASTRSSCRGRQSSTPVGFPKSHPGPQPRRNNKRYRPSALLA